MKAITSFTLVLVGLFTWPVFCQSADASPPMLLRVFVQGDTSRLPDFVKSLRTEFSKQGMALELVERDDDYNYNMVIAQESSMGGAAAVVIALDKNCNFVASVVRSGRWSGKGALNASAKEMAKKIAILKGVK